MEPIVTIAGGAIRGRTEAGVTRFLGVPYAAAPVGARRFRLPEPAPAWTGVREATEMGATCAQSPYPAPIHALIGSDGIPGDEYLNANVWTPDPTASGLPVLVWIHGGAFVRGSNARAIYDGSAFARDGVVLVSINYRLGISGFAALDGAPLNRGLHDQIFALEWVRDNVAAFGGDPDNVTVFGESAGGMSVAALIAAPRATGPTHVYEFAWPTGLPELGACHVLEVPFVFDVLADAHSITGPNPPQALADEIHTAWVRFATDGDPGWPAFEPDTKLVRLFDTPESSTVADPRAAELDALRQTIA